MTGEFSPWGALALLLLAALALFHRPLGCLLRLAVRSSVGLAVLALFSSVGHYIGVNLGVNLVNALVLAAGSRSKDALSDTFKHLERVWSENNVFETSES